MPSFVAAADGDPDADVWVNGARVSGYRGRARSRRRRPAAQRLGVVGAQSGAAYVFRDPNGARSNRSTTSARRG